MSTYEKYNAPGRSEAYDKHREPDSAGVFVSYTKHLLDKPLRDLHVLDAGCGTGNYGVYMLEQGVAKVTFLDASDKQLGVARDKLERLDIPQDRYSFIQASLPHIPIADSSIDVVVFAQVVHHVMAEKRTDVIKEAVRCLQPGGLVCIAQSTPIQIQRARWAFRPWEKQLVVHGNLQPRLPDTLNMFESAGLIFRAALGIAHKAMCIDPRNDVVAAVSNSAWRASDSFFSHVADEELVRGIEMLKNKELVHQWKLEAEGLGVETAYIAQKPGIGEN